jgi:hypothetical protein
VKPPKTYQINVLVDNIRPDDLSLVVAPHELLHVVVVVSRCVGAHRGAAAARIALSVSVSCPPRVLIARNWLMFSMIIGIAAWSFLRYGSTASTILSCQYSCWRSSRMAGLLSNEETISTAAAAEPARSNTAFSIESAPRRVRCTRVAADGYLPASGGAVVIVSQGDETRCVCETITITFGHDSAGQCVGRRSVSGCWLEDTIMDAIGWYVDGIWHGGLRRGGRTCWGDLKSFGDFFYLPPCCRRHLVAARLP